MARIPISAPIMVGTTKVLCPVTPTIRPKPSSVKAICTKTPSVISARTLAAAIGSGVPLIAAKRARTMSPPTAAEGTSVLTDSPTQRIQSSCSSAGRSDFGKRTHHATASRNTGTAKWNATTAAIAQPAEAKAAPTWGAPCRMSRIVKSAAPARPSSHTVIWIFPGAFIACSRAIRVDARRCAYPSIEIPEPRAADHALSGSRLAQETLRGFFCRFHAHHRRFAKKRHGGSGNHASPHWLGGKQTKRQPKNSEYDRAENVGQKMRAQRDTAESDQGDQQCRASNCQPPPVARLHCGKNKKSELPVKQGRPDGVTAGKTVTGPIYKGTFEKRTLSVDEKLHPFVEKHAARHSHNERHQRRPVFFPHKIQHHEK